MSRAVIDLETTVVRLIGLREVAANPAGIMYPPKDEAAPPDLNVAMCHIWRQRTYGDFVTRYYVTLGEATYSFKGCSQSKDVERLLRRVCKRLRYEYIDREPHQGVIT